MVLPYPKDIKDGEVFNAIAIAEAKVMAKL